MNDEEKLIGGIKLPPHPEDTPVPPPARFKVGNSPTVSPDDWAKSLLSEEGWDRLGGQIRVPESVLKIWPLEHRKLLSEVGYELLIICSAARADDPIYPMAYQALTKGCGLSYSAVLDALEECDDESILGVPKSSLDWVPSRFAALLLQRGVKGVDADRVMRGWAAGRAGRDRMVRALERGVTVSYRVGPSGGGAASPREPVVRVKRRKGGSA
jgi:hypothetical protein